MSSSSDFPARGKVTKFENGFITFIPTGTSYELKLSTAEYTGPLNTPIECFIHVKARRLWTIPNGGNFIAPIFGPPKTIQGRILLVDEQSVVVQAGVPIIVELPINDMALDLNNGSIGEGTRVNVVAFPGAIFVPALSTAGKL